MLGLGLKLASICVSQLVCSPIKARTPRRRFCKHVEETTRHFPVHPAVAHRTPLPCSQPPYVNAPKKPCFDIHELVIERGCQESNKEMSSFLRSQYFTREPSLVGLYLRPDDPYIDALDNKYTHTGDRFFAYEVDHRRQIKTLVGVCIASKKYPWEADRLEKWALNFGLPAQYHALFYAHIFRDSNVFNKYKVPYIYNVDVVVTSQEASGLGVADLLLRCAMLTARELRFPIIQIAVTNSYMINPCKRAGMSLEWSKRYTDFRTRDGTKYIFCVRQPHESVSLYIRHTTPVENIVPDPCKDPALYEAFQVMYVNRKKLERPKPKGTCSLEPPRSTKCPPDNV